MKAGSLKGFCCSVSRRLSSVAFSRTLASFDAGNFAAPQVSMWIMSPGETAIPAILTGMFAPRRVMFPWPEVSPVARYCMFIGLISS